MKQVQMHVRQTSIVDSDTTASSHDGIWRRETPFFPRWVEGRFRRKGLECRRYLVGGHEADLRVEWRVRR